MQAASVQQPELNDARYAQLDARIVIQDITTDHIHCIYDQQA